MTEGEKIKFFTAQTSLRHCYTPSSPAWQLAPHQSRIHKKKRSIFY